MQPFIPAQVLVEARVAERPLTRRLKNKFPKVPWKTIDDAESYKEPFPHTAAKKILILAEAKGEALKPFPKISHAINLGDYVFSPISNCHLECTYCILQSYLRNNPALTVFPNLEHFFSAIDGAVAASARPLRLGTGELSDSLALDGITELSRELVPFFAERPKAFLELKTKSDTIENLLGLEHRGQTVVSFSLSPKGIAEREELKCASTSERIAAAKHLQAAGYPIGLHFDPVILTKDWEEAYRELIAQCALHLNPKRLAWVSIGSLRFDKELKEVATERFPHTRIFSEDFIAAPDGKLRYFKTLRCQLYAKIWGLLRNWSEDFPRYLCMEPPWMWEAATGQVPTPEAMEATLVQRLHALGRAG